MTGKPIYWPYPASGMLMPGSETILKITTLVDEEWSRKLSTGEDDTNGEYRSMTTSTNADVVDVLVLQVEGGKDSVSRHRPR